MILPEANNGFKSQLILLTCNRELSEIHIHGGLQLLTICSPSESPPPPYPTRRASRFDIFIVQLAHGLLLSHAFQSISHTILQTYHPRTNPKLLTSQLLVGHGSRSWARWCNTRVHATHPAKERRLSHAVPQCRCSSNARSVACWATK